MEVISLLLTYAAISWNDTPKMISTVFVPEQSESIGVEPERVIGFRIREVDIACSRVGASVYESSTKSSSFDIYFRIVGNFEG